MSSAFREVRDRRVIGLAATLLMCLVFCPSVMTGQEPAEPKGDEDPGAPPVKELKGGGDDSADFRPFVTNIAAHALPDEYLVAQLVTPKWHDDENRIVWPTERLPDAKMKFPTEQFIDLSWPTCAKRTRSTRSTCTRSAGRAADRRCTPRPCAPRRR